MNSEIAAMKVREATLRRDLAYWQERAVGAEERLERAEARRVDAEERADELEAEMEAHRGF